MKKLELREVGAFPYTAGERLVKKMLKVAEA
jgi:hypothetical protein